MWRGRLEACCFVGSIRFDITPGPAGNFLRAIGANTKERIWEFLR